MISSRTGAAALGITVLGLAACSTPPRADLPVGQAAYAIMPPADPKAPRTSYQIVPNDLLNLQVFLEPDLSNPSIQVDDMGNIQMPLIGEIRAAGRSSAELAGEIADRLRQRYLVDPQVVVSVTKQATRLVTVEGQVNKPGVYEIERGATLLSAIARAEGPSRVAKLQDVVIFRAVDGDRFAARFDLAAVRAGTAPDPRVLDGDVVVIGFSKIKGVWRDVLVSAPLFNVFFLLR